MFKQLSHLKFIVIMGVVLFLFSYSVNAQTKTSSHEEVQITKANRAEIIDSVTAALVDFYVFPEVAQEMKKIILKKFKKGKYKNISTLRTFTDTLTIDLQAISHDLHLHVDVFAPESYAEAIEENPEEQEKNYQKYIDVLRRSNFGFKKVETLHGNIGYMDLHRFSHTSYGGATAVAAMNYLANSDALIIDLRKNGGGSPSMVQLLSSYLLEEHTHLNSFYIRDNDQTKQFWTQVQVQGPKMTEIPLYIITSPQTFSAAEEFTYNLKHLERATIIGQTTGGGAHPVSEYFFRITDEVMISMSIPYGKAINPITNTNWEGVGIEPDFEVLANEALDFATLKALQAISENASEDQKVELEWAIVGLTAKITPLVLEEGIGEIVQGNYGPRKVTFEDGVLFYQRGEGVKYQLISLGNSFFALDGYDRFRIQFVHDADGSVNKLIGNYNNGRTDSNIRDKE